MKSWLGAPVWVMIPPPTTQSGQKNTTTSSSIGGSWKEGEVLGFSPYVPELPTPELPLNSFQFEVKITSTSAVSTSLQQSTVPNDTNTPAEILKIVTAPIESEIKKSDGIFLEFELIKRRDGENLSRVDIKDMTSLTYLNEPEMIRCLEERYFAQQIYTSTGPILIAINPYKTLNIYDEDTLNQYIDSENMKGDLDPHIFQISDNAYKRMLGDKFDPDTRENQSILVNGESGAGKTESTKHCLHYLAVISSTMASRLGMDSESGNIENQIIASNPITESFGNAKTSRNNNSSRFGKFIELGYNADGIIENGSIRTYLLENVRVNTHVEGERNFHIFYELAAHSPEILAEKGIHSLCDFKYTNCTMSSRNSITSQEDQQTDRENYATLIAALNTMGIDPVDQEMVEDLIICILHIGNLTFNTSDVPGKDDAIFSSTAIENHVPYICDLLGITEEKLMHAIGRRSLTIKNTHTETALSVVDVLHAKDNFAKTLYNALFHWVLNCINESLNESTKKPIVSTIGVLDIFGFEFFENNSLEQLCINYTNEKLQDHFNTTIFKSELELYKTEGITIKFDGYPDNSHRIELLENSSIGIFALCNEKLKLRGHVSYQAYAQALYDNCSNNPYFVANKFHKNKYQFLIKHYAGDVVYNSEYFIEKNRNEVVPEFQNCLSSSSLSFIQNLSSYLDPDDIHSVTSKAGILTRGMPSPTKSQRILGSASPAGVGKSPSRTSSRSMLFTPNKPKVSFLEPTQSSSTHPSTPPITPSTIQRSMTTTGTTSSNTTPSSSSSSHLLQRTSTTLGSATRGPQRTGTSPKIQSVKKKSTLFTSFTKQLHNLIDSIKTTRSHFIRCIKPNSIMSSNEYNYQLVMSQLRCGGVLGAIQVFRAGFPNRFYFLNFIERYLIFTTIIGNNNLIIQNFNYLKRKSLENPSNLFYWKVTCQIFLQCIPLVQIILDLLQIPEKGDHHHTSTSNTTTSTSNGKNFLKKFKITTKTLFEICSKHSFHLQQQDQQITIGKKQIFLRAIYYEYLENLLYRSNSLYAHIVQHNWKYRHLTSSINSTTSEKPKEEIIILHFHHMFTLQPSRYKIKLFFQFLISFQRRYRVYYHSRRFRLARYLSTWISSHYRGGKARIHIRNIKINMIKKIQKLWRSYYQYKIYHKKLQSIRSIQGWYRTRRYEMIRRREGQRFQDGIQYSLIKLQARYRGSKVRILYNKLLLEKMERRKALQLLFPNHYQFLSNTKILNDFTDLLIQKLQGGTETLNQTSTGTSPISHDESKESHTPPVVLYQKDSMESESPEGQSPAKSSTVQSPLHIGDDEISSSPSTPYELDSNSRIAALEAEIVTLKNYIERLEEQVAKSRNNRFLCFS